MPFWRLYIKEYEGQFYWNRCAFRQCRQLPKISMQKWPYINGVWAERGTSRLRHRWHRLVLWLPWSRNFITTRISACLWIDHDSLPTGVEYPTIRLPQVELAATLPRTNHSNQQCMSGQFPDSKVHGGSMGPIWGRQVAGGPHVGPMNFADIRVCILSQKGNKNLR